MAAPPTGPSGLTGRDGRDLENGRDLEVVPLVHESFDPSSRWHRFKQAIIEPPKATVSIYADIPFNHQEWKRHRNAAWRHRPQPLLFMRVAGGFWWQLTYTFLVSLLVGVYHWQNNTSLSSASRLSVPFNLTTFALSLLLVFRTNSSYSRWWEARMIWGAVVNLSRNFARQSLLWLPAPQARVAVRWMMAAPYLLKCHLRFNASVRENVSHILLPQELDWVLGWTHRPNAAAHVLGSSVVEGKLDTNRELVLMELVNTFIDCVGKCERIFKTPIPAAYTRHTSRYLMIYLTACPLVLWPSLGWWTPIAAVLITFLLLGTENIGVQLEEPFRVLPLDDMCRGIEATLREIERQHNHLDNRVTLWSADPAGIERADSESSLDSFQDGPTDGPSDQAALDRFHHIPPPKPIAAAAEALRMSFRRHSGHLPGGHMTLGTLGAALGSWGGFSPGTNSMHSAHAQPHGSWGESQHGVPPHHPHGGLTSAGGSAELRGTPSAPAGAKHGGSHSGSYTTAHGGSESGGHGHAEGVSGHTASMGAGGGMSTAVSVEGSGHHLHYPHTIHHRHRHLPQHPADQPARGTLSPDRSNRARASRLSHEIHDPTPSTMRSPFANHGAEAAAPGSQGGSGGGGVPGPSPPSGRVDEEEKLLGDNAA
ncbi:hypothetical protein HYH03_007429 [Edaphochlamys debaryana]|uniref:Uncharacterized protein n=1 Tax=Edaphochlamys debaryana TaxID=47281 RepID=A0A835Y0G7_9CHLO|nr:hypothetical protein HYH03_007429 [Edaphochlamys debaryana]|eukprot:KAG2494372.1 hypothetical protein HYH03_007429 [Edaphochlamys debaryana]